VDNPRFGRPERYRGELRLIEKEFEVKYGMGKTIFMENCNDLFSIDVPGPMIERILSHCKEWPDNTYVFQTKDPFKVRFHLSSLPVNSILGVTVETNRDTESIGRAPLPANRIFFFRHLKGFRRFITIEPILDFDVDDFAAWLVMARPDFVNIGADSKGHGLPEPPFEKVMKLIEILTSEGIDVREKHNLDRLRTVEAR